MRRAAWFAGGMVAGVALLAAGAVIWWTYRDFDAQEFAG